MRAWSSPSVPSLGERGLGAGADLRVHDRASGGLMTVAPERTARMYVCGITPYDATHLGHAATYLAFDLAQRVWLDAGLRVLYTQNVTDIDDPLLERAANTGVDWRDLAESQIELFRADMSALRIIAPAHFVGAVEAIPRIVTLVEQLEAVGAVYSVDGDRYFSVHTDPDFGRVSGLDGPTMRALFAERGGDPDRAGKRDPLDCLLWQSSRPDEPSWPSSLGPGRPGWHVECAAIALEHLGMSFQVQGGGSDLVFPHHEMSASEAQVALGRHPFAQAYVHAGMVGYDGAKMSKSLGNLVLVSALREKGFDPLAIRLALLAHHYRTDWEWTDDDLAGGEARLADWRDAASGSGSVSGAGPGRVDVTAVAYDVREALAADLDAPRALAVVDAWAARGGGSGADVSAVTDALLGVPIT